MGLADFADAWPKMLSGGMRQRLAIARAYAVQPEFLLMDEPFGALDAQTRSAMQDLLLEVLQAEGKTVMLITHSVEEAVYLSDRIIVMTARPTRIREVIDGAVRLPARGLAARQARVRRTALARPGAGDEGVCRAGAAGTTRMLTEPNKGGGNMSMNRRRFMQPTGAVARARRRWVRPAIAQARTKVKVGYLHTLAVDGQIWTGMRPRQLRQARPRARARASSRPASRSSRR